MNNEPLNLPQDEDSETAPAMQGHMMSSPVIQAYCQSLDEQGIAYQVIPLKPKQPSNT